MSTVPQDGVISPYQQLQENPTLVKRFAIGDMHRLRDSLESDAGEVKATFSFKRTDDGIALHVQSNCHLQVLCQRCMEPMACSISIDHEVLLVQPGFSDQDFAGDYTILTENKLSLHRFLEDELLLALPLIAKHDNKTCHAAPEKIAEKPIKTYKPFANLAQLRGKIRD